VQTPNGYSFRATCTSEIFEVAATIVDRPATPEGVFRGTATPAFLVTVLLPRPAPADAVEGPVAQL
jgi:hypothetical protein